MYCERFGRWGREVEDAVKWKVDAKVAGFYVELDFGTGDEVFWDIEFKDAIGIGELLLARGEDGDFGAGDGFGRGLRGVEKAADEHILGLGDGGEEKGEGEAAEHGSVGLFEDAAEGDVGLGVDELGLVAGFINVDFKGLAIVWWDGEGEREFAIGEGGGALAVGFDGDAGDGVVLFVEDGAVEGGGLGGEALGGEPGGWEDDGGCRGGGEGRAAAVGGAAVGDEVGGGRRG